MSVVAILGAGCAIEDEDVATTESEIIGGTVISAEGSGNVLLTMNGGLCSGTLMTNTLVLTAQHCVNNGTLAADVLAQMGSQSSLGAQLELHPSQDVAVIRLATPFAMNGSTTGFRRFLFPFATNTLSPGTLLTCRGFGISDRRGNGAGVLRTAELPVRGVNFYHFPMSYDLGIDVNALGQDLAGGDSGTSCLFTMPGGEQVVTGVHSWSYEAINNEVSADSFRAWYSGIVEPQWAYLGGANAVTGMAGHGTKLFAATSDNRLWLRDATAFGASWQHIGHANGVTAMAATSTKLFAVTSDGQLWQRDPFHVDINWVHIGHANNVVAMTALGTKLYVVTSDNKLWEREVTGGNINWTHIGHANGVRSMAAMNGQLFVGTADHRLWSRDANAGFNTNWAFIGHAPNVTEMTALNGSLFAVNSFNQLVMR